MSAKKTTKTAKAKAPKATKTKKAALAKVEDAAPAKTGPCASGGEHVWTTHPDGKKDHCEKCYEPFALHVAVGGPKGKKGKATPKQTGDAPRSELDLDEIKRGEKARAKKAKVEGAETKPKKLSAIDAAVKVLAVAGEPMNCVAMIEAMASKGLWTSPGGKTPHATLYSAILSEIGKKGKDARFKKMERGKFAINA